MITLISGNIKRLREVSMLSQKEVSAHSKIPQGQYSRIENGKVEPSLSSLEKLSKVFDVPMTEFFKQDQLEEEVNLSLLEKIQRIDELEEDEKNAILKMIDIAISKKRMKDNLTNLLND